MKCNVDDQSLQFNVVEMINIKHKIKCMTVSLVFNFRKYYSKCFQETVTRQAFPTTWLLHHFAFKVSKRT